MVCCLWEQCRLSQASLNHRQSTQDDMGLTVPILALEKDGCLKCPLSPKTLQAVSLGRSHDWSRVPVKLWFLSPLLSGENFGFIQILWKYKGPISVTLGMLTGKARFSSSVQEMMAEGSILLSSPSPCQNPPHKPRNTVHRPGTMSLFISSYC